jgi:spoIIIJ-associated protein
MSRQVRSTGPTVDAAVAKALEALQSSRHEVRVEVLASPRRGFFGGARPAEVRVTALPCPEQPAALAEPVSTEPVSAEPVDAEPALTGSPPVRTGGVAGHSSDTYSTSETDQPHVGGHAAPVQPEEQPVSEATSTATATDQETLTPEERMNQIDEEADLAADFVEGLLDCMDLPGDIEIEISEDQAMLNLEDVGSGLLIGRRGATLDALQELIRCSVQRQTERRSHVRVDVEGYRSRYVEKLRDRAREAIAQVRETGEPVRLDPMDAYERKLMHDLVAKTGGVTSGSEGVEPKRRVVIHPDPA